MSRLKLDPEAVGISVLVERFSGVPVKDCFQADDEMIYIIIEPGYIGRAIGKGGMNIHNLQQELHKKIKFIEFHENPSTFVKNIISPIIVENISEEEHFIIIKDKNRMTKSLLIGREGKNLLLVNRAVKRFFPNKEVKVENLYK
ncbi:NusA-like transcription termination signal-binding factor [Candidatus Woesearchaeota archaeon]|nr:NusA-like transcription termination signal-binding factor [Candidatus Woesearchaeota archaeon]